MPRIALLTFRAVDPTGTADRGREFHLDHRRALRLEGRCPIVTERTLRTGRLLGSPIHLEILRRKTLPGARLPMLIHARGTDQVHAIVFWTAHQLIRLGLARIYDLGRWQQARVTQGPLNRSRRLAIVQRCHRRTSAQVSVTGTL